MASAMDHKHRVFASIFPVPALSHTTPTPIATPDLGFAGPGRSFGSPFVSNAAAGPQLRAVRRNVAWSTATRFLSLPKSVPGHNAAFDALRVPKTADVEEALQYLLVGEGRSQDKSEEELVEWFANEVRLHFAQFVRPGVRALWGDDIELRHAWDVLEETHRILQPAQTMYMQPFAEHILPVLLQTNESASTIRPGGSIHNGPQAVEWKLRRDIHATFAYCLPQQRYAKTLSYVLYDAGCRLFRIYTRKGTAVEDQQLQTTDAVHKRMTTLLRNLEDVGLGGDKAQKAFAHSMDKLMDSFIASHYVKVDWSQKKSVVPDLRSWVENGFAPMVQCVLECLNAQSTDLHATELKAWQEMALGRLGRSRVENLFDFVISFDKSLGAILDIKAWLSLEKLHYVITDGAKEYLVTVPNAKQYLSSHFSQQISRRLLHPGATTTYILDVYIFIIWVFHELEPKGVLLERVARPIRRYLKERDDTARVIILSLLSDADENTKTVPQGNELSYEIASEMQKPFANFNQDVDEELNWDDMNWQPLPSDASPEYKKSKVQDVIWFLLTLWDREDFINELKNILGDHLLRCQDPDFEKEIRLLELIKIRLGEEKLQACEVMLRDMLDSKRINATIRAAQVPQPQLEDQQNRLQVQPPVTPQQHAPQTPQQPGNTLTGPSLAVPSTPATAEPAPEPLPINAHIISSFFWPSLRDDEFSVPPEAQRMQQVYESHYERLKKMRKLEWIPALSTTSLTLELEDRTERFDGIASWQATVIFAFLAQDSEEQGADDEEGKTKTKEKGTGITRNVEQLEETTGMEEGLLRQALAFWVGKAVLREISPSTYAIIENASTTHVDEEAAAAAEELAAVQAAQAGAVRTQEDVLNEKREVYASFIVGMLTAQGNIGVGRILMMMRMMVQGGFPFGEEEVKGLLTGLEEEGKVVSLGGDVWGVRKK